MMTDNRVTKKVSGRTYVTISKAFFCSTERAIAIPTPLNTCLPLRKNSTHGRVQIQQSF